MNKKDFKISQAEFDKTKIARLSDRPNASTGYGGNAFSAQQLKERHDASATLIRERFNALVDAICGYDDTGNTVPSLTELMKTELGDEYSVAQLLAGLASGEAMQRIKTGIGEYSVKGLMQHLIDEIGKRVGVDNVKVYIETLDAGESATINTSIEGEGENALFVFHFGIPKGDPGLGTHENGTSISENALAIGPMCFAGSKGYRYIAAMRIGNEIYYTLDGYNGGYEVGDVVSIRVDRYYDRCGKIVAIDGDIITVEVNEDSEVIAVTLTSPIEDKNTLRVPDKPTVGNVDIGICAIAFGSNTMAIGPYAHAEGNTTRAEGKYAHAEGVNTEAIYASHAEGRDSKALGQTSHAEGWSTEALGNYAHAEGHTTHATNDNTHAEGWNTIASGKNAHAEGESSEATHESSHSEGFGSKAYNKYTHAEGKKTTASGEAAHSEGDGTTASARAAHAEGVNTTAEAQMAHAEGYNTHATSEMAHTEGANTTASGKRSHAEGNGSKASGNRAHAEGETTTASGEASHAEGNHTKASGAASHAGGTYTIAGSDNQTVIGRYNIEDTEGKYAFIIGNGTGENSRSNAMAVRWDGTIEGKGSIPGGPDNEDGKKELPEVTAADAGKFLRVSSNGTWVAEAVISAEEVLA